jgi:GNAT superfamily N-acetyltransferase
MNPVRDSSEVAEAINRAKAAAPAFCVNFFPAPGKLEGWIEHCELFLEMVNGATLFMRKDRDFWHLYFCAASSEALQRALAACLVLRSEPVVVDLVGKETALSDLVALFEFAGFRRYNRLFRMSRTVPPAVAPAATPDSRVVAAGKTDCQPILDLLLRSFDCRAEQIPMLYEIEAAVEAGQIRVAHCACALAGLLFFETQGLTSTLRYWLVAPEFRTYRLGSALMNHYFAEHPTARRFLLWVLADNHNAISKYEHYGFAPDGLVDTVLANELICQ